MDAIEAMRLGIGPGPVLSYVLQGMYHPARRVREVYWRMYSESKRIAVVAVANDPISPKTP